MLSVLKGAAITAGASLLIGQAIDVQLSGAQVVGWAISIVGILLAGLISLVTWFASKKLEGIEKTLSSQNDDLSEIKTEQASLKTTIAGVVEWKNERQKAHDEASKEQIKRLQGQLDRKQSGE